MASLDRQHIPLQISQNCVVAAIQIDLTPEIFQQLKEDLLEKLQQSEAEGVIIDISGVEIMDLNDFDEFRSIINMVKIMGAKTVISGFKPELISALVDLDANIDGIDAALNLDDAFVVMNSIERSL